MRQGENAQHKEVAGEQEIDVLLREDLEENVKAKQGATGDDLEVEIACKKFDDTGRAKMTISPGTS